MLGDLLTDERPTACRQDSRSQERPTACRQGCLRPGRCGGRGVCAPGQPTAPLTATLALSSQTTIFASPEAWSATVLSAGPQSNELEADLLPGEAERSARFLPGGRLVVLRSPVCLPSAPMTMILYVTPSAASGPRACPCGTRSCSRWSAARARRWRSCSRLVSTVGRMGEEARAVHASEQPRSLNVPSRCPYPNDLRRRDAELFGRGHRAVGEVQQTGTPRRHEAEAASPCSGPGRPRQRGWGSRLPGSPNDAAAYRSYGPAAGLDVAGWPDTERRGQGDRGGWAGCS